MIRKSEENIQDGIEILLKRWTKQAEQIVYSYSPKIWNNFPYAIIITFQLTNDLFLWKLHTLMTSSGAEGQLQPKQINDEKIKGKTKMENLRK